MLTQRTLKMSNVNLRLGTVSIEEETLHQASLTKMQHEGRSQMIVRNTRSGTALHMFHPRKYLLTCVMYVLPKSEFMKMACLHIL
jgi:hypothetical protein